MNKPDNNIESRGFFPILIWAMYDFANTIYSMNVVSLYFPLVITADLKAPDIWVSGANSISMILIVLTMPLFGILSDRLRRRMPFLAVFTIISVIFTAGIGVALLLNLKGMIGVIVLSLMFILANYGFQGGLVFYNTLLPRVADKKNQGWASGFGTAVGYLGSVFGMILVLPFNEGKIFSLNVPFIEGGGRAAVFIPTAIMFLLFAIPTLVYFREKKNDTQPEYAKSNMGSFKLIKETLANREKYPGFGRFLVANFLYNDGIQTAIIFMAVFAEKVMGMTDSAMTGFFMFSTIGAFIGSMVIGKLADRFGYKKVLVAVLTGWVMTLVTLSSFPMPIMLWILGMPIGALLGGVWTCARPMVVTMAPKGEEGRYFGLYALSSKMAAIFGPLLWGAITFLSNPKINLLSEANAYRAAILALAFMIGSGGIVLSGLPNNKE